MLQICSGKLFKSSNIQTNNLRGVIYTNLALPKNTKITTKAGSILSTENITKPNALLYEIKEKIELPDQGPVVGLIASHTLNAYISDFCAVLSFALNCTASPNSTVVERLLSNRRGISTHAIPNKVISRVFDSDIYCSSQEEAFLSGFVEQLIGLKRSTYLSVMRAILTYVTAMHRIVDDLELAYTLLVASIESLAQDFDGYQSTWTDYNQEKKKKIDIALSGADDLIAEKVRSALLEIEHTSLGRRFKDFTLEHINSSYYREEAIDSLNPISKYDLASALSLAYQARSQYIHNLKRLPKQLTTVHYCSETYSINGKTWLSIQGLSRLARHVIIEFIFNQKTVQKEEYDYSRELYGIMDMPLSPEFWVGRTGLYKGSGSRKLEGFLQQLLKLKTCSGEVTITDLGDVLKEVEVEIHKSQLKKEDKLSYIALYILYNYNVHEKYRLNNLKVFHRKFETELLKPSSKALIAYYLFKTLPHWDIETHYNCLLNYFKTRNHKFNFRAPAIFETGIILALAERYRLSNDYEKSLELIRMAIENYPGNEELIQLEIDFKTNNQSIDWANILLKNPKENI